MSRPRILLIEDEANLRVTLTHQLERVGYLVMTADDGLKGQKLALSGKFDLIILDLILPERDGLEICRHLRKNNIRNPILMITARGEVDDKLSGFRAGSDDYLVKPFDVRELEFRVAALLRRRSEPAPSTLESYKLGNIFIDFPRGRVVKDGQTIRLNERECRLLSYLIVHKGAVLSREELLAEVWGYSATLLTRTVDVHILWLRQKLETDPQHPEFILTVYGQGYRFAEPADVASSDSNRSLR